MKKFLSIILCLVALLCIFAVPVSARTTAHKNCEQAILNGIYNMNSKIDVSSYNVHYSIVEDILLKIYYHYPELGFYVDVGTTTWNYNTYTGKVNYVLPDYTMTKSEVKEKRQVISNTAAGLLYGLDENWSDTLKALFIHDRICVYYQYDNTLFTDEGKEIHHMLQMMESGEGVCQAYAEMYGYLLRLCGIKSYMVISDQDNHSWNIVQIDGNWYHVDVTHDDPIVDKYAYLDYVGNVSHEHFLLSASEINDGDHDYPYIPYDVDESIYCNTYYGNDSFKEAVSAVIPMDDGYWYYIDYEKDNGGLVRTKNFGTTQLIYEMDSSWGDPNGDWYYYYFSGLFEYNGNLFFNTDDALYVYDPEDNITKGVMELSDSGKTNGRFYGFYMSGNTCYFMVAKDAKGLDMKTYTAGVCDYGHTIEKWEVVTEATMFVAGKKVKYCDTCFDITEEVTVEKIPIPAGAGDCDGDGSVNTSDLVIEKLFLAGSYGNSIYGGADFDKDGIINTSDLALLKLYLAFA